MARDRERRSCRERLERLEDATVSSEEIRREAIEPLARALGFERWCWPVADPVSLLGHSGIALVDYWQTLPRMIVLDQADMPATRARLARSRRPAISLHAATEGDLARDPRWSECQEPYGMGDELTIACRDERGCWGWLQVHRDTDQPPFDAADVEFAADVAPLLGTALRRGFARSRGVPSDDPPPPGVLLIDEDLRANTWTPSALEWLRALPGAALYETSGILPTAVYSAASRHLARRSDIPQLPTRLRVRTTTGRWATLDAAALEGSDSGRVAVTIRASSADEVLDMLTRACGLTAREGQLVSLLATGLSTRELAEQLFISQYTVKDHLKAIFDKVGVRSRRELVAEIAGTSLVA